MAEEEKRERKRRKERERAGAVEKERRKKDKKGRREKGEKAEKGKGPKEEEGEKQPQPQKRKKKKEKKKKKDKGEKRGDRRKAEKEREDATAEARDAPSEAPKAAEAAEEEAPACAEHPGMGVRYYCVPCERAVCADCRVVGRHQGAAHECLTLAEACARRLARLRADMSARLGPYRGTLAAQLERVNARARELRAGAEAVELETRDFTRGMLQRLADAVAARAAGLDAEGRRLAGELAAVNALYAEADRTAAAALGGGAAGAAGALAGLRGLEARVAEQRAVPSATPESVLEEAGGARDLPREAAELARDAGDARALREAAAAKEEMVWHLLRERQRGRAAQAAAASRVEELDEAVRSEAGRWAGLTDRLSEQLERLRMACQHCGVALGPAAVNTYCTANGGGAAAAGAGGAGFGAPGTGVHRFVAAQQQQQ